MAGTSVDFNSADFIANILATMTMGMPVRVEDRLTWHWNREKTFPVQDPARNPYDWTAPATTNVPGNSQQPGGSLQVPYALEYTVASSSYTVDTPFGEFNPTKIEVTLLDNEYQQIKTADYCTIEKTHYEISFVAPSVALFDVNVWTVLLESRDES